MTTIILSLSTALSYALQDYLDDAGGACGLGDRGGPLDQGGRRARRSPAGDGDYRRLAIGRRGVACRRLRRPRRGLRGRGLPGVAHGAQPRPTVGGFPPRVHLECLHGRLRPHHRAVRVERRLGRAAAGRGGGRAHLLRAGRGRQPFAVGRRRRGVGGSWRPRSSAWSPSSSARPRRWRRSPSRCSRAWPRFSRPCRWRWRCARGACRCASVDAWGPAG